MGLLAGTFSFVALCTIQCFAESNIVKRLSSLLASVFALGLLLNCLFSVAGNAIDLGDIDIVYLLIDILYVYMLFDVISSAKKQSSSEEQQEEKAE